MVEWANFFDVLVKRYPDAYAFYFLELHMHKIGCFLRLRPAIVKRTVDHLTKQIFFLTKFALVSIWHILSTTFVSTQLHKLYYYIVCFSPFTAAPYFICYGPNLDCDFNIPGLCDSLLHLVIISAFLHLLLHLASFVMILLLIVNWL